MDSRLKPAVAAAIVLCLTAGRDAAGAAYRVVAARDGAAPAHRVVHIEGPLEGRAVWEEIGSTPLAPPPDGPFVLEGRGLPAVAMEIARAPERRLALSRGAATLAAFAMRGACPSSTDAAAIDAEGSGFLLRDAATGAPLAGQLRITRRLAPSPWQSAETERIVEETAEAAWAAIP